MKIPNIDFNENDLIIFVILCLGIAMCWASVPTQNMQILNTIVSGLLGGWTAGRRDNLTTNKESKSNVPQNQI